ncbi:MAG: RidA family protein, partial [Dehalococcoidia bacterium]
FSSRLHGNEQATGKMVEGGLQAEAPQIMKNIVDLMEAAGASKDDVVQVNTFGNDTSYMAEARKALEATFPDAAKRPAFHPLISWVRATSSMMAEFSAVTPGGKGEQFQEIFLSPEKQNIAAGVKLGQFVFAGGLPGADPETGKIAGPGTEEQLRRALDNVDLFLKAAGAGREHLCRVNIFMADVREKDDILNPLWAERFPDQDNRPPHSYIPAKLPEGHRVSIQVIALLGATRRSLYVEGVEHGDPMTLAAQTGNLVFSSRIFGGPKDPLEHTDRMFTTGRELLKQVGGDLPNLQQALFYMSDPEYRKAVEAKWNEFTNGNKDVRFNYVDTDLSRGHLLPRLQMIAIV